MPRELNHSSLGWRDQAGGPRWTRTAYLRARLGFVEASGLGILNPSFSRLWAVRALIYRLCDSRERVQLTVRNPLGRSCRHLVPRKICDLPVTPARQTE